MPTNFQPVPSFGPRVRPDGTPPRMHGVARALDIAASITLLAVQCFGVLVGFVLSAMSVMVADNCFGETKCGSADWITAAMAVSLLGGAVLAIAFGGWSIVRLCRRRLGCLVAAAGVAAQAALIYGCLFMASQAGPI